LVANSEGPNGSIGRFEIARGVGAIGTKDIASFLGQAEIVEGNRLRNEIGSGTYSVDHTWAYPAADSMCHFLNGGGAANRAAVNPLPF
jgi:hypothetical protein